MCGQDDQPCEEKPKADAEKEDKKEWKDIIHLPDDLEYDVH